MSSFLKHVFPSLLLGSCILTNIWCVNLNLKLCENEFLFISRSSSLHLRFVFFIIYIWLCCCPMWKTENSPVLFPMFSLFHWTSLLIFVVVLSLRQALTGAYFHFVGFLHKMSWSFWWPHNSPIKQRSACRRLRLQLHVLTYPRSLTGRREKNHFLAGAVWEATPPAFFFFFFFADSPHTHIHTHTIVTYCSRREKKNESYPQLYLLV